MRNSLLKLLRLFVVAISLLSSIGAAAQSQRKITLKMENSSVETILNEIERQTDYLFVCESLDLTRKVSVNIVDKSLDEAMSHIFNPAEVSWKVTGSNVYLYQKKQETQSQSNVVSGIVKDSFGEPLVGAAVIIKGTTVGAGTDLDGNFEFEVPADLLGGGQYNSRIFLSGLQDTGSKTRE